jgi:hypothetical protein
VVKHIVLWRLKEHAEGHSKAENARLVKEKLESLRGRIPGLIAIEVGINFAAEAGAADLALYSEFESRAALDAYQTHPEHVAMKGFIGGVRAERWVVDYEH